MTRRGTVLVCCIGAAAAAAIAVGAMVIPAASRNTFLYEAADTVHPYAQVYRKILGEFQAAYTLPEEPGFTCELENELLALYLNPDTFEIMVFDRRSGTKWYSNPALHTQEESGGELNAELQTQVSATAVAKDGKEHQLNSYDHALSYGQISTEKHEQVLSVLYVLGKNQRDVWDLPPKFRDSVFRDLYNQMAEKPRMELRKLYSFNSEFEVWVLATPQNALQQTVDAVFAEMDRVGFTQEKIDEEFLANNSEKPVKTPVVEIPVEYRLEGDSLEVRVINEKIVTHNDCEVKEIRLLQNFGSGRTEEGGIFLLPDGSGSLLEIGKEDRQYYAGVEKYTVDVYGGDLSSLGTQPLTAQRSVTMPVIGVSRAGQSFLCIIESGEEQAFLETDPPKLTEYYRIYTGYRPCSAFTEEYVGRLVHYYSDPMTEDYAVRYRFFENEDDSYTVSAREYQKYLTARGLLVQQEISSGAPVHLEILGTVESRKRVLGISYLDTVTLTDYQEAEEILQSVADMGFENIQAMYRGMAEGGLQNDYIRKFRLNGDLGSTANRKQLFGFAAELGIGLFPDISVLWVDSTGAGFSPRLDASRDLRGKVYSIRPTDYVSQLQQKDKSRAYLLAAERILPTIRDMADKADSYGFGSLALRDFGEWLYSTMEDDEYLGSDYTAGAVVSAAAYLKEKGKTLMLADPNQYLFRYADTITDLPMENNGNRMFTRRIPFVQIVLHGYVEYSSLPVNATGNYDEALLKAVETGSIPKFAVCARSQSLLKTSEVQGYYTAEFSGLRDAIEAVYAETGDYFAAVAQSRIIAHRELADDVYETEYDNGVKAVVNYGKTAYACEEGTVEPADFLIFMGQEG